MKKIKKYKIIRITTVERIKYNKEYFIVTSTKNGVLKSALAIAQTRNKGIKNINIKRI